MKLGTFLAIAAVIYILFGVGFYLAPGASAGNFGMQLEAGGILHTRILGSSLIGFGVVMWLSRAVPLSPALRGLLWGGLVYNVLDLPFVLFGIGNGTLNAMAWSAVAIHVAFVVGFGYFAWRSRAV